MNAESPREIAPPHAVEAEQVILGACMARPQMVAEFAAMLTPEMFYDTAHGDIFQAIIDRWQSNEPCTPEFIIRDFRHDERFVGKNQTLDLRYIIRLKHEIDRSIAPQDTRALAGAVVEMAARRSLLGILDESRWDLEMNPAMTAQDAIDKLAAQQMGAMEGFASAARREASPKDALLEYMFAPGAPFVASGLETLDAVITGFRRGNSIIIGGRPSMGKAQPLDANILMADGTWRKMGDIRFGDALASVDGAPSRVAGVFPQGRRPVFKVTLSDGRSTRCCGEHLWAVSSTKWGGETRVIPAEKLRDMIATERFRRRIRVPLSSGDAGVEVDLPVDPWLLGVLIGNGGLTNGSISVSVADAATLYRVQALLGDSVTAKASNDYDYRLSSPRGAQNWLLSALGDLGLRGHRSEDKFIPEMYMRASRRQRVALIQGLMDTDGWVETFGAMRYSTSSRRLADQVQELVRSVGGVCSLSSKKPHYKGADGERREGLEHYVLNIRHPQPRSLVTLTRKARRLPADRDIPLTIVSIEPDGEEDVQCIAVSHPRSLYVTDEHIVTHNTALAVFLAYMAARRNEPTVFYSYEMTLEELTARLVSLILAVQGKTVPYTAILGKRDRLRELDDVKRALDHLERCPLVLVNASGMTVESLRADVQRQKTKFALAGKRLGMAVVDYLGLIAPTPGIKERIQQIGHISRGLKAIAKHIDIPMVTLAQLNRANEQRQDKRPQLSDLRESGDIEQDADTVIFVHRESYYLEREGRKKSGGEQVAHESAVASVAGEVEFLVPKNRHGAVKTVLLGCDLPVNNFYDIGKIL